MFSSASLLRRVLVVALAGAAGIACAQAKDFAGAQAKDFAGVGRSATPREIAAWDIDVRPDFKGLPKGSGSVSMGQHVWEARCAQCHGIFAEGGEGFAPLVGGTTADDVRTGRVTSNQDASVSRRTLMMKLATLSTLWDYIHRAMPWKDPKSLTVDEVYGVTAFVLNLGGVVSNDFVLSDTNIAQVQQRMPNRNGMTLDHALWPGQGLSQAPDTHNLACMKDCTGQARIASQLPEYARMSHGNLAEQNRSVGAQRGAETSRPAEPRSR